jgi:4-aminobutyrate aminotransferase-like enzyme
MTMAKGIADGFPVSAFTVRPDIADAFTPGDHLSTFGGSPVACAAAVANIEVMQEDRLPEAAAERGAQFMGALNSLKNKRPLIGDVRGKGLMIGIELVKEDKAPAPDAARAVRTQCLENGVLVGVGGAAGNVVRLQPPLTITAAECERALSALEKALKTAGAAG